MTDSPTTDLPLYDGNDIVAYVLAHGFELPGIHGAIRSITNVRDTAVIVTDWAVWRIRPSYRTGFCVERVANAMTRENPITTQLVAALEALTERAFDRCLFPAEVRAAFEALDAHEKKSADGST